MMAEAVSAEVCKERHKNVDKTFQMIEDDYRGLHGDVADLSKLSAQQTVILENVLKLLDKHDASIEEIKSRPARRWDAVINTLISVVIGAAFGLFLSKWR